MEGLVDFLHKEKGFAEDRVRKGADTLAKAHHAKPQGRLDSFFKLKAQAPPAKPDTKGGSKRKGAAGPSKGPATKKKK